MKPAPEQVLYLLGGLFAVAALLILLTALFRRQQRQSISTLWPVYATEFLIIIVVLLPAWLGPAWFLSALLLFNYRAHREIAGMPGLHFNRFILFSLLFSSSLLVVMFLLRVETIVIQAVLLAQSAIAALLLLRRPRNWQFANGILFLISLSMVCLLAVVERENGFLLLLFLYVLTETNDSFAYLTGKLFGKRKLFPAISPNKTVEGLLGGIAVSILAGLLFNHFFLDLPPAGLIILVCATIFSAVAGDVLFSLYKRSHGRKDFPGISASHGGVLDIYDSLLVASIVYYFLLPVVI